MVAPVNYIALKIFGEWKLIMRLSSKIVKKYESLNVSSYKKLYSKQSRTDIIERHHVENVSAKLTVSVI